MWRVGYAEVIREALRGGRPLLAVRSSEEARVLAQLRELAQEAFPGGEGLTVWTCLHGFSPPLDGAAGGSDPAEAVAAAAGSARRGVFAFCDLDPWLGDARLQRALRESYAALRQPPALERAMVLVSAEPALPAGLGQEVLTVRAEPPGRAELLVLARERAAALGQEPEAGLLDEAVQQLLGLSLADADHALRRVLAGGPPARETMLRALQEEKARSVREAGLLEFVAARHGLSAMGGLEVLKEWLLARQALFSPQAVADGLPIPKGVLFMGVSGCGKSFAVKAISAAWGLPLYRLDMNLLFSGRQGSPEAAFHEALRAVESVAPAVLWIDEIENGLGMVEEGVGRRDHLFSAFLTWLQEKPPLVFVAATANRIEVLPPELLRKGRFDQVFFCDLPGEEERRQIFEIHLRAQGADPATFQLEYLVYDTKGWSGAEIEQAVIAARVEAWAAGRTAFTQADVSACTDKMVPLSRTMREKIRALREWSLGRAVRASHGEPEPVA